MSARMYRIRVELDKTNRFRIVSRHQVLVSKYQRQTNHSIEPTLPISWCRSFPLLLKSHTKLRAEPHNLTVAHRFDPRSLSFKVAPS